jgi:excisionase family DNA binding protein
LSTEIFALTNTFFRFILCVMGKLLSTTEAAARVGLSVARIQTFIWEKRLPALKVGRSYAIDEDDLKLLANRPIGRPPGKPSTTNKAATQPANGSHKARTVSKAKKQGKK